MAKEQAPAFQFYPKDFLCDERVLRMSNTEVGVYIRLLCSCWLEASLPLETAALASMVKMPIKQFTKLWENSVLRGCFYVADDGRLHHKRLDEERLKQETYRRRQSDNGKRGGRPTLVASDNQTQKNPSLSQTEAKKSSPISHLPSPVSHQIAEKRDLTPRAHETTVLEGALPRNHLNHAWCSDDNAHCVPGALHGKLLGLLAPRYERPEAHQALLAWYPTVVAALPPDHVMNADAYKFWLPQFDAHFATPTAVTALSKKTQQIAGATAEFLRGE